VFGAILAEQIVEARQSSLGVPRVRGSGSLESGDWGRAFIDLAALGRRRWRSYLFALLRIVLYPLGFAFGVLAVAMLCGYPYDRPIPMTIATFGSLIAGGAAVVQTVARSHRRPWLSLISRDLTLDWRRLAIGCGVQAAFTLGVVLLSHWAADRPLRSPQPGATAALVLAMALIPFQAASEELLFRGYLTQEIGRVVRSRLAIAGIVGVLFAALHMNAYGPLTTPYIFLISLMLSFISLRDGRLELAIGVHTGMNWVAIGVAGGLGSVHPHASWGSLLVAILNGLVVYAATRFLVRRFCSGGLPEQEPAKSLASL
jgi:membrane protease YdiL (CAAX protease family)